MYLIQSQRQSPFKSFILIKARKTAFGSISSKVVTIYMEVEYRNLVFVDPMELCERRP